MKKVILTKEQAKAMEELKSEHLTGEVVKTHLNDRWSLGLESLNDLTVDEFAQAYYSEDGYEVEPEYKVGDWIVHKNGNPFNTYLKPLAVKITSVKKDNVYYAEDCNVTYSERIRHATPSEIAEEKERRFFARHYREPWELRNGDMLIENGNDNAEIVKGIGSRLPEKLVFFKDGTKCTLSHVKVNYRVVVFAEDRLDVKNK